MEQNRKRKEKYYNRGAMDLETLQHGDVVRVQPTGFNDQWQKAQVNRSAGIRSYEVITDTGKTLRRNRRHLRKVNEHPPDLRIRHDDAPDDMTDTGDNKQTKGQDKQNPKAPDSTVTNSNMTVTNSDQQKQTGVRTEVTPHETTTRYGRKTRLPTYLTKDYAVNI